MGRPRKDAAATTATKAKTNNQKARENTTKKKKERIIELLDKTDIAHACEAVGICTKTFYNWKEKDEKFRNAIEDVNLKEIGAVKSVIKEKAKKGDLRACELFMIYFGGGMKMKTEINATTTNVSNANVNISTSPKMSNEEAYFSIFGEDKAPKQVTKASSEEVNE